MNRTLALTKRNLKEMSRDPISLIFCIGLPLAMLVLMQLLFGNIKEAGASMFEINHFAPAIINFGFTFIMLYISLTISGDRCSAFSARIYSSPVKPMEYLASFLLATLPVALVQIIFFYAVSIIFGFEITGWALLSVLTLLVPALFYAVCGIFIGTFSKSEKQCGPISSLFITASGLLGGIWMPIETMGGTFLKICKWLPFYNGVKAGTAVCAGNLKEALLPMAIVLIYAGVIFLTASLIYRKKPN